MSLRKIEHLDTLPVLQSAPYLCGYVFLVTQFEEFLISVGLPSENIIASIEERENIMNMLPSLIQKLPSEQKRNATYLSRFVAGSTIGLFDAALNYVWDEVVVNLRRKITYYGIDIFLTTLLAPTLETNINPKRT